jgi:hypothetical protein
MVGDVVIWNAIRLLVAIAGAAFAVVLALVLLDFGRAQGWW